MSQRRAPSQSRSRDMVNRIMESCKALIVAEGDVDVSMREIASQAGIAPSSVYQYFDSRDAVLLKIVESYFQDTRSFLRSLPPTVYDKQQLTDAIGSALQHLLDIYNKEPALLVIMDRIKRSPALTEMDVSGSKKNSAEIAKQILQSAPDLNPAEVKIVSDLLTHLVGWGVRYAASIKGKKKQQDTLRHLQSMIVIKIETLVNG